MGSKKAYIYILEKLLYLAFWLLLGVQTQTLVHGCSLIWVFWKNRKTMMESISVKLKTLVLNFFSKVEDINIFVLHGVFLVYMFY